MSNEPQRSKRRNGEGSIYQRKSDGRWVGAVYLPTATGAVKRKVVYGATWDYVHQELTRLIAQAHRGIPIPDRSCRVSEYLEYWLSVYASQRRETTARGYEGIVRLHLVPGLGSKRLDKLSVQDVNLFLTRCRQKCMCCTSKLDAQRPPAKRCCLVGKCCQRKASVRQVQYIHAVLRNALGHAMREELVSRNVASLVRVAAPRYKIGKGLKVEQVRTVLAAVDGHRLQPLYLAAATMGLRRGELLGMRWSDLDLDIGTFTPAQTVQRVNGHLRLQETKSEDSDSVLPIPEVTWLALLEHRDRQDKEREAAGDDWQEHDLVFPSEVGTPMEPRNLNRHWERLRERLGMQDVRLHDLRHTMVSLLLELGVPPHIVQALARHADVEITLKIYAHTNLDAMRQAARRLDDHLG
ncbi:site-specific integrase [Rhizocola hellebori]|uniref:Site-specific integrase n=1 Tax=Rhizocola hellebori TaxID=1392758 RepID=A0A8J3QHU4_9ACTN|nr:site-specific integrase [Rhizocola hellebori]GIH10307.1 site-specific integrase [Rhizocola hellebori]